MSECSIQTVAVVGTGVIGRSWIRVFARAGCETRVFDPDTSQQELALSWAKGSAEQDEAQGLVAAGGAGAEASLIRPCASLSEALSGAQWAQESGPEALEAKKRIFADLDSAADFGTILASSTSAQDMSRIAHGLAGARRCITAHPVNPPHVVPVVEVLPGSLTDSGVVTSALDFLKSVGQTPVEMNHYLPGFLLNRLQAALVREAVDLIGSGAASAEAIDAVVRDGLGLRWALLGPFGTGHTNADGGVGEYYTRYGDAYRSLWADLATDPDFSEQVIQRIHKGTEEMYGPHAVRELADWRDRMVRRIRALKEVDPPPNAQDPLNREEPPAPQDE